MALSFTVYLSCINSGTLLRFWDDFKIIPESNITPSPPHKFKASLKCNRYYLQFFKLSFFTFILPSAPEVDAEECIRSIKYDNLSTSEFDSCWQACSQFRLDQIYKETTLHTIFEEWPDYKKPGGYRLVSFNFKKLY